MGPLEIEIRKLTKQIDETDMELVLLQRHWLKHQKILVTLTQEREEQLESMDMQKKEITIKEQKRVRIESKCAFWLDSFPKFCCLISSHL